MNVSLIKQPSALLPIAMSVAALALVLGHVAIFGVVHEADEGTAAHLWQLLMAGQVPVVAYFAQAAFVSSPNMPHVSIRYPFSLNPKLMKQCPWSGLESPATSQTNPLAPGNGLTHASGSSIPK